jgi:hypothetical protein
MVWPTGVSGSVWNVPLKSSTVPSLRREAPRRPEHRWSARQSQCCPAAIGLQRRVVQQLQVACLEPLILHEGLKGITAATHRMRMGEP